MSVCHRTVLACQQRESEAFQRARQDSSCTAALRLSGAFELLGLEMVGYYPVSGQSVLIDTSYVSGSPMVQIGYTEQRVPYVDQSFRLGRIPGYYR